MFRPFTATIAALTLSACAMVGEKPRYSHGPAITGYGPIHFGMTRDASYSTLQGRGQLAYSQTENAEILSYRDYIGYMEVMVNQHFDEKRLAKKAVLELIEAAQGAKTLNECRGYFGTMLGTLESQYGAPDWNPKIRKRSYGQSGITVFTFADSSNIEVTYDFTTQSRFDRENGLCRVKLGFNPPWV